ncbi:MAG: HAMP domain-containing protein [Spirochaetales bacterium]|nr:HAMP domain-containing protein [Spirochaetales bacterium]
MRMSLGFKIGSSLILILLVFTVSSLLIIKGVIGLRDGMDESLNKSEQMNMLFRYNNMTTRVLLSARNLIIDPESVKTDRFRTQFDSMKKEIHTLMTEFLDLQESAEDRNSAIRIFGGSSDLLELIDNSLVIPLQNGVEVDFSLVSAALDQRSTVLNEIDKQIDKLEDDRQIIVEQTRLLASGEVRNAIISITVSVLLVFSLSLILIRLIVSPVRRAARRLQTIAEGEGDLTRILTVSSRDELGDLAGHFNSFLERLKGIVRNIKDGAELNLELEKQLVSSGDRTVDSINRIRESLSSISGQIDQFSRTIDSSITVVRQISANITSLNTQAAEQSAMAEESSAAVTEMIASMENVAMITEKKREAAGFLTENTAKGRDMLDETVEAVEEIYSNIDDISAMTDIISGIASQTNLLSMNAAIEAAHAGDAGKGFAVVADEIRKLAETTGENSTEIAKVLQKVIEKIRSAVHMSGKTQTAFETIEREISDVISALDEISTSTYELKSGGGQILEAMTVLRDSSVSVKNSVNEIDKGSDEMEESMGSVRQLSDLVIQEIEGIGTGMESIRSAADEVRTVSSKMSRSVSLMAEEVNKFKT